MTERSRNDTAWVLIRKGMPRGVFKNRREAIKYLKATLAQVLKDLKNQDESDEYDYPIHIPEIEIISVENREPHLGL